jgi:PPOX class probable F420-dependent enzyme
MAGRQVIEIDESTDFGARVAAHLRDDVAIWMTTVTPRGGPLPSPVWFHWDGGDDVIMFSQPGARQRNIEANPRVSLNFAGDGRGGDIVVLSGPATIEEPSPERVAAYVEKYAEHIPRIGLNPESFRARYSVPIRIELTRLRGH